MPIKPTGSVLIQELSAAQSVRARPSLYLGCDADSSSVGTILLREAMCHALDEAARGACDRIAVTLLSDGSASICDNGPGMSLERRDGVPLAELMMTRLFACRQNKQDRELGEKLCGIGMAVVNALSEWCELIIDQGGKRHRQQYRHGEPRGPFEILGEAAVTGTTISFKPDLALVPNAAFDLCALKDWLDTLSQEMPRTAVELIDRR